MLMSSNMQRRKEKQGLERDNTAAAAATTMTSKGGRGGGGGAGRGCQHILCMILLARRSVFEINVSISTIKQTHCRQTVSTHRLAPVSSHRR